MAEAECIDRHRNDCAGATEYRESLSGTGTPIARCDKHWRRRLDKQDEINRRYAPFSDVPPAGFDPAYAGERWEDD
jgi:hypothetical protein